MNDQKKAYKQNITDLETKVTGLEAFEAQVVTLQAEKQTLQLDYAIKDAISSIYKCQQIKKSHLNTAFLCF